jgi:long-chain acyl-CoA synthetase
MSDHPWIKSYPPGVRWDAPVPVDFVHRMLDDSAARWPDGPALDFMDRRITYAELHALVNRAARGFQQLGVGPGVHVGLYLPNTPHYVIAFFGVLKAGGTVVNYSPLDAARVLEHKVEDSETDILVTLDLATLYPQMAALLGTTRLKTLVVGNLAEMSAAPDAVRAQLMQARQLHAVSWDDRHCSFEQLLASDGAIAPVTLGDPADALAVLQYTGGTTGLPKGAMLTHANLSAAVGQFAATASGDVRLLTPGADRILTVLPLFHVYALAMNMLFGLRSGAELILHMRFDVEAVLEDLVHKKVTMFAAVPTMYSALVNRSGVEQLDFSSLRFCSVGGAPVPIEVSARFFEITGCNPFEGWGLTETSPAGTFTPVVGRRRPGSCGLPLPGIDIRFASVDDPTRWLPRRERGEICLRGPNVMKGYWKNPEATAEVMTADGFFRTGDVGTMDEDGYVYIVDRIKDLILCGGFNVYPRVLEDAVYEHPAVAEVVVIGIHDDYRGQSPKAFVRLKDRAAAFTLDELKAFLAGRLGKHEMVQALEIRTELPRTPVGKLSKKELYEEERLKRAAAFTRGSPA